MKDEKVNISKFSYNFINISKNDFKISLHNIHHYQEKVSIRFYQSKWQQNYLDTELKFFNKNHHHGLGKFLTKSNLQKVYKNYRLL